MTGERLVPDPFAGLPPGWYTPEVQAARRAYVRALATQAATHLVAAEDADDGDELASRIADAHAAIGRAVGETMRGSLA